MTHEDSWSFYKDEQDDWRWRRIAANGEIVGASTEGYRNRGHCRANAIRNTYSPDTWQFYKDTAGDWRWRRTAPNHRIVGAASEGYRRRGDCTKNARRHGFSGF